MRNRFLLLVGLLFGITSLLRAQEGVIELTSTIETTESPGDGATSSVIWLHPTDLNRSLIIGSDDNEGVGVYDLAGQLLQFDDSNGGISQVDIRYGFGPRGDVLLAGGVKDEPRIIFYTIDPETLALQTAGILTTSVRVTAFCLYHSPLTDAYYAIAISEYGELEQYEITLDDGEYEGELKRAINIGGEVEFCTVDDDLRRLYISEGDNLVWRYGAEPEDSIRRSIVDTVGGNISEETEGIALYTASDNQGYLIITNEKADSFLIYERGGDNAFIGEFALVANETIDAVSEPTGVTAVGLALNDTFPQGVFITTDDVNSNPNANNNFKLVSWGDIATALGLITDTTYDPRRSSTNTASEEASSAAIVTPLLETQPVPTDTDAADDPAIWIHPTDTSLSTIIGTDKRNGLVVYNLDGSILQRVNIGRVNNVDLRYNFPLGDDRVAIIAATNRTENSLVLYAVNPNTREIYNIAAGPIISNVEEVYGVCLYVSPINGRYYAFVNSADTGEVEQYEISSTDDGEAMGQIVRTFKLASQTEGCVVDDENATLYIGEEAIGFWKFGAEPDASNEGRLIDSTEEGGHLTADVEGIALYRTANGGGYLIVSSQGADEFVVYERGGDNAYIGTFRVIESEIADAVSGTDGLDVTNFPMGTDFPDGLLIVQDDLNLLPRAPQNFKLIPWSRVANALDLVIDTSYDPRQLGATD